MGLPDDRIWRPPLLHGPALPAVLLRASDFLFTRLSYSGCSLQRGEKKGHFDLEFFGMLQIVDDHTVRLAMLFCCIHQRSHRMLKKKTSPRKSFVGSQEILNLKRPDLMPSQASLLVSARGNLNLTF